MPTVAIASSDTVRTQLAQLNEQAMSIRKGNAKAVAHRAIQHKQRKKRLEELQQMGKRTEKTITKGKS